MKKAISISVRFDSPELISHLVEQLARCISHDGYFRQWVPYGYVAVDFSFTEIHVSGIIILEDEFSDGVSMPFTTCYMYVCTREMNEPFKMFCGLSFN
ncbi:MAG: hypothetical protein N2747_00235 [Chitinophagaceae bacterium]|nr:hypothetical protein [Chitinophagaceae bacterium]